MIKRKAKKCSVCSQEKFLWKSNPPTCKECALTGSKPLQRKPLCKKLSPKAKAQIDADTRFYQEIWDEREHSCEECGVSLDNGDGEWQRIYFSHILSKGAHPELRHEKRNFNILCGLHHTQFEFGKRKHMKINEKNKDVIVWLLNRSIERLGKK